MNKKDCKIGMFVAVMQNTSSLSKNRSKVKRIGKIVGVYSNYVNLLLFDSNISTVNPDFLNLENITIYRKLYIESFRFCEISKIEGSLNEE